jgi:NhaP-type Na+/H+ or K+/H+ antiporter
MSQLNPSEINIALLTLGGLVIVLGLFSGFLKERLFLSDPILALLVGVLLGPFVLGWIDLAHWGKPEAILEQGARLAIAIQLMGVALRLPMLSLRRTGIESAWVVNSLIICASILAHGFTAVPLSKFYSKWHGKHTVNNLVDG